MIQHGVSWPRVTCPVLIRCASPTSVHLTLIVFPFSLVCWQMVLLVAYVGEFQFRSYDDVIYLKQAGPNLFTS